MWIQYFGTAMSVIIAVSLMQKNIRWLRIINAVGAIGFAAYGVLIGAVPVMALNSFIFFIDLWFLFRMRNSDDRFDFLAVDGLKSLYVRKFIEFHKDDIISFFPDFNADDKDRVKGCLILRDVIPVSIILYRLDENNKTGEIIIDYSIPSHRDRTNARYFFDYVLRHVELGSVERMTAQAGSSSHQQYLKHMGFTAVSEETELPAVYERSIN
ncbi:MULTISPECIES: hypothetical protein [unclassified Oceanispirochaeta]|uniref:hypothetical protein n=1 Tax=unclassified Oceanispirochaeta TaxID=2635722 RepID=UPI000E09A245|nr:MULTISPECIES: hypothetical protein [unclassified Oceanispirochaeta]MBF9015759.1 hypothetical protein [Oceanispirochaeta sp. M2]NPD72222.1 hypothetical protein [Oceanispirochaeta sp. M1]RDG32320.1 hypothetical protein DV872_08935 [Oceanispirochaeta sp. M1]